MIWHIFLLRTMEKRKLYGYISIILSAILWGASFVWSKGLLNDGFPVFTIVTIRIIIASVILLLIFATTKKLEKIRRKDLGVFFLLAFLEPFLYFIGENGGLKYVSSSFASMMIALIPIFVAFTMYFVFKEKLRKELLFGVIASILGVVMMSYGEEETLVSFKGIMLLMLAVLTAAAYSVTLQVLIKRGYGPVTITTWQNILALVFFVPCFFIFDFKTSLELHWTAKNIIDLICLGVLCSAGAYGFYSNAAKMLSVSKIAIFTNLIPVVTIIIAVSVGQENVTLLKALGILIAVSGVIFSQSNIFKK